LFAEIKILFCEKIFITLDRWIWGQKGWLKELGVIDNSGCGVVHQMGGFAGKSWILNCHCVQT
jgi:ammonia channel protein AmtB